MIMSVIKFFGIPWGFEEDLGPYDITGWFSPKTDDVITIYVTYDKVSYINQEGSVILGGVLV
jgi:hypothetical protein